MSYQDLKTQVKQYANSIKNTNDKPLFNASLNDFIDYLSRNEIETLVLRDKISEKKAEQYREWLSSYVCKLHK